MINLRYFVWCSLWWSCVFSSEPGPEDCLETLTLVNNSILYVPNGTVCFECNYSTLLFSNDVLFRINDKVINNSSESARVLKNNTHLFTDTLVVFDTAEWFKSFSVTYVQCCVDVSNVCKGVFAQTGVFLIAFNPPLTTEETTVVEGSTLNLFCDGSNSAPQPTLQWISPNGKVVGESGELTIVTVTRNMAGIYTCVATLPGSTATMNISVDITILPKCPTLNSTDAIVVNMSSTAVGSTATYQCRDGPTDVYTTQCTSTGDWDPLPLSTLDCTSKEQEVMPSVPVGVIVPVAVAIICIVGIMIAVIIIAAVCVLRKRQTNTKKNLQSEDNRTSDGHVITFAEYPSCNDEHENDIPMSTDQQLVVGGGYELYSTPRSVPATVENQTDSSVPAVIPTYTQQTNKDQGIGAARPSVERGMIQEQGDKKTVHNPAYEEVRMGMTQFSGGLLVAQRRFEPEAAPDKPPVTYRTLVTEDDGGRFGTFREPAEPAPAPPPPQPTVVSIENVKYAQIGIIAKPDASPKQSDTDTVQYASLDHNAVVNPPSPDASVCLDQILIQLREVTPHWRRLGEAVGVHRLDEISRYVGSESEAMVEVVDGWLLLHPNKPTWREIADVVDSIGHTHLAHSLRQVYLSGQLPIQVSNAITETVIFKKEPPPAIPPRKPTNNEADNRLHGVL